MNLGRGPGYRPRDRGLEFACKEVLTGLTPWDGDPKKWESWYKTWRFYMNQVRADAQDSEKILLLLSGLPVKHKETLLTKVIDENWSLERVVLFIENEVKMSRGKSVCLNEWIAFTPKKFTVLELESWWSAWRRKALDLDLGQTVLEDQFFKVIGALSPECAMELMTRDVHKCLDDKFRAVIVRAGLHQHMQGLGYSGTPVDSFQRVCRVSESEKRGVTRLGPSGKPGNCYHCGDPSHWVRECPKMVEQTLERELVQNSWRRRDDRSYASAAAAQGKGGKGTSPGRTRYNNQSHHKSVSQQSTPERMERPSSGEGSRHDISRKTESPRETK